MRRLALLPLPVIAATTLPLHAQEDAADAGSAIRATADAPAIQATRLREPIDLELDGHLDDAAWSRAPAVDDFTQQEPVEGAVPSERTVVRVLFDDDALYIGAKLFDDPEGILAYQKRRDEGLGTDDRFMWILDTFRDGRTGYFFEINPAGLHGDGIITGGSRFGINKSWDGIWEARVARLEDGWSAEIEIPFSTLNFDPDAEEWGINFQRTIRRRNEEILWRGWRRNQGLFTPVHAGRLEGLADISQGVGLEAVPYTVQTWRNEPGAVDEHTYPGDVGLDFGYSVTPSLRAALSVNTDFAEVEVDQRRVNLTRFPLRFPERRDFFLEGSGVYTFAPRSGVSPYFSRRIGLEGGEPVPIHYGGRLGGQAGPWELGLLQVGTGAAHGVPSEDFSVARVRRRLFGQTTLGAIYTRRASSPDSTGAAPDDRHTFGVDLDYQSTSFLGGNNAELEAFWVWNSNPDPAVERPFAQRTARGFRVNFPNDIWAGHLSYREFGDHYDPAVGFVTRTDFRRVEPRIQWRPRPSLAWLRRLDFNVQFRYLESLEQGVVEEKEWRLGLLGLDFESGDNLDLTAVHQFEYLDAGFEVSDGVPILPGEYGNWEYTVRAPTASHRPVSLDAEVGRGGFWDGERSQASVGLEVRPDPGLNLSADYEWNGVALARGDFETNLVRVAGGWDLSPWVSVTGNVQYDDVSEIMGVFGRATWIVRPGNEIYLVYTHNWRRMAADPLDPDPGELAFTTVSRGASVKVNYTWRW